jgi:hypothetical protein
VARFEKLLEARGTLPRRDPLTCYHRLMEAIEETEDMAGMLEFLTKDG